MTRAKPEQTFMNNWPEALWKLTFPGHKAIEVDASTVRALVARAYGDSEGQQLLSVLKDRIEVAMERICLCGAKHSPAWSRTMTEQEQLGFGFEAMAEEQRTAYLPSTMEEAIPFYRKLIERHHEAMIAGDIPMAIQIRKEAHELAVKLNNGDAGICGGPDAPGNVLERETAAPAGTVPLWGQAGDFTINVNTLPVRIDQDGMFGTGTLFMAVPGFGAHAVDYQRPFLSETGYRSFLGLNTQMPTGMTPDVFAKEILQAHIERDLKGKLRKIERGYVEREMERRAEKDHPKETGL